MSNVKKFFRSMDGFDTVIEESVNETVDFKITVSFE